jgi:Rps23 Pro-64 3,4-dihydroxylase Tpa1-like proline 4-hydroxylase
MSEAEYYRLYRGFLDSARQSARMGHGEREEVRAQWLAAAISTIRLRDFGPVKTVLHRRLLDLVPTLIRDLRVTPFEPSRVELELVANNDGAFFKRHIDMHIGATRLASDRLLSAVYYFHAEPKAFSGGALRLYSFGAADKGSFADVQPEQNTLLVFPSWVSHEVLRVNCPSRRFSDSRFNVNCWVHRCPSRTPSQV